MGQRNTLCTHQMLDLEAEPGYSRLHPDHCILQGNIHDYPGQNIPSGTVRFRKCSRSYIGSANQLPHFIDRQTIGIRGDEYGRSRSVSFGAVEMANMSDQGWQEISSSLHPASLPYFQQHPQPVQNMQIQSHSHHTRILAPPYQHLLSNMHPNNPNPSNNSLLSGSRFLFFPSNAEQRPGIPNTRSFLPRIKHSPWRGGGLVGGCYAGDPDFVEPHGLFGESNIVDEHHDMRLDIDGMSYEELLALEEQIGDVNTGLTEEFILKNLKTIIHGPQMSSLPNQTHKFAPENEACIICQVEYDEKERIGILDCGHSYHAGCIRQWLSVKNLCPICKASALTRDRKDG
ncbi:probable E3 ubiquitin-protein ligase ZFP1 [Phoenix dactylifera]|uniref:RING-type E3 ubiquitin transferase n=1 Tax=Phoenix dactylifera TaxID=42345 RepID=A0A8B9A653_PHODC|nr:probable E3 ubiquitin-protein ligase ZFP1 [Phoenix dactylifera]